MLAILTGMMGYLAFGNSCQSVLIYDLPNNQYSSIIAKVFYLFTIVGSFIILIQPIFYVIENSKFYKQYIGPFRCEKLKFDCELNDNFINDKKYFDINKD